MKANRVLAILLAVVIIVVSLAGCAEKKNMVPVEHKGLKFSVPEGWEGEEGEYDLFYQTTYDGGAKGYLIIGVRKFPSGGIFKEFSSWGLDVAKVVLDLNVPTYLVGYEAVSTEEMLIDGQPALVHRCTSTDKQSSYNTECYVTGINTNYIFIDASFDDVDDKTVEAEMKSDMDAFIKSIDLSGLD